MKNLKRLKKWWMVLIASAATGCTISVVDTHTESGSTESVSETLKTVPKLTGSLQVPIKSDSATQNVTVPPKK